MESDRFLQSFNASDRKIAEEFLTNWLPFLTEDLCEGCSAVLRGRIRSLNTGYDTYRIDPQVEEVDGRLEGSIVNGKKESLVAEDHVRGLPESYNHIEPMDWDTDQKQKSHNVSIFRPDMVQQDNLEEESRKNLDDVVVEEKGKVNLNKTKLPREQRERIRFAGVGRKKDFVCLEKIDSMTVNILAGLELHTGVFSAVEQKRIVDFVYDLQEKGRNNGLGEHTYSEPKKWMRGKGTVTMQFGCCYNYVESNGMPPGIICNAIADPIPNLFKIMIKRLIRWHVLPTYCVPDSCIVNIFEPGDCIPPHIDNHDFVRPFCTVSFLSECNIVFGSSLKIAGPGEFIGSTSIPLSVGSVLVVNGNGADVAQHCVPAVPYKRISITFSKMDKAKRPHNFKLEPDLQNIEPYDLGAEIESQHEKEKEFFVEILTIMRKLMRGRSRRDLSIESKELFIEILTIMMKLMRGRLRRDLSSPQARLAQPVQQLATEIVQGSPPFGGSGQQARDQKPVRRTNISRMKFLNLDEAEELMERSSMNDDGSNSVSNRLSIEWRVQMQ